MSYCDRRLLLPFWFASMRYRRHALVVQRAHHQGRGAEEVEGITRVQLNMFCSHSTAHSCQPTCHPARRARPDPPPRPPADLHPLLRQTQFRSRLDRHCSGGGFSGGAFGAAASRALSTVQASEFTYSSFWKGVGNVFSCVRVPPTLPSTGFITIKGERDNGSVVFNGSYTFEGTQSGQVIPLDFPRRRGILGARALESECSGVLTPPRVRPCKKRCFEHKGARCTS